MDKAKRSEVDKYLPSIWQSALRLKDEADSKFSTMKFAEASELFHSAQKSFSDGVGKVAAAKQMQLELNEAERSRRAKWPKEGDGFIIRNPFFLNMAMKWCPPGSFVMGSPENEPGRDNDEVQHHVTLAKGFWIAQSEVTQDQWRQIMNGVTVIDMARRALNDDTRYNLGEKFQTLSEYYELTKDADPSSICGDSKDTNPIYHVNWYEAMDFCKRLNEQERKAGRLPDGYEYRLPTEAEWEYACRAGTTTALPNGEDIIIVGKCNAPSLDAIAWYSGNSSHGFGNGRGYDTASWPEKQYVGGLAFVRNVMEKQPNSWGLYDMLGNVMEWCIDDYAPYNTTGVSQDPVGIVRDGFKAIRGGGWNSFAANVRSARRIRDKPRIRLSSIGFRVALAPKHEALSQRLKSVQPLNNAKETIMATPAEPKRSPQPPAFAKPAADLNKADGYRNDDPPASLDSVTFEYDMPIQNGSPIVVIRPFTVRGAKKEYINVQIVGEIRSCQISESYNRYGGKDIVLSSHSGMSATILNASYNHKRKRIPVSFKAGKKLIYEVRFD